MEKPTPENVYILAQHKPTKDDADSNGNVLYYSISLGWHQGSWIKAWKEDVTHWTYLPEAPPRLEDQSTALNRKFNTWVEMSYPNVEPAAKMLLRLGFEAGFKSDR